jgi:ribosomal protein S12 methylthiotransferase accessory factor
MVVRPLARSLTVSQGKGISHDLALVSGVMECIELHHAEHFVPRGHLASLRDSWRSPRYVDVMSLAIRNDTNVNREYECEWIAAFDINGTGTKYVPRDLIDLDFCKPGRPFVISSSNGLASGNTFAEAVLHGLCELVERDQLSFWLVQHNFLETPDTASNSNSPCFRF